MISLVHRDRGRMWACYVLLALLNPSLATADEQRAKLDQFEREVRPILADHCFKCHGADKQESDLRLDSRAAVLKGGMSGPAIVVGEPEKSLLIGAIRYMGDLQMPPKGKLNEAQIAAVTHWVKSGAPWPTEGGAKTDASERARKHWAFQPVREEPVPIVAGNASPNPIDAFVKAKLASVGLRNSAPADRRALIRRVSFALTGLPPAAEDVEAFQRDPDLHSYPKLVERLLSTPQYGEQWGRHWLDVARYSDTKGYVYAREQRFWIHASAYRDWVVRAFNDDLPYDRFLLLQIAADQAARDDQSALAAMGFLTLGRRFLGVSRDIIDDRIDVVTRGTMGLTVACARCHDHKYDPIPTRDYYSLYGVFQNCSEHIVPIGQPATWSAASPKWARELANRQEKLAEIMASRRLETATRNRVRAGDYLAAQLELHKYPAEGFDQVLAKTDLLPTFVHRWRYYLEAAEKRGDPAFVAWNAFADIPSREFASRAVAVAKWLQARSSDDINSLVMQKFATPPTSMSEVVARYAELFADINRQWQTELQAAASEQRPPAAELSRDAAEAIRQVLYGASGPCEVPDEPIVNIEYFFDSGTCDELWKLQNQVDNWILQSPLAVSHAVVLNDRPLVAAAHVFKRGNPANLGDEVPRQFVAVLAGPDRQPFTNGSGRLELARAIIDAKNPLTARVMVNRVWTQHFGAGLVRTPSDFGTRADPPSHPELLDWLTSRFIEDGWSLKKLHRRILTSETYCQSSSGPRDVAALAQAAQVDPQNRLLWRMNTRRLSFEEMRDSFLAAAGQLDGTVGGRAGDLQSPKFARRTLYGTIDRQFLPSTLRMFDFANPDLHIPLRSDTTVPQQALYCLNHPLVIAYAKSAAARTAVQSSDEQRIQKLYRLVVQREPTPIEMQSALAFVRLSVADQATESYAAEAAAWQYGFGRFDEKTSRTTSFMGLPHFTGTAWQGGPTYPDVRLGWLQLTAGGGHPGNDLDHAAIRRWTAPCDLKIRIRSSLVHEPRQGEGVRGFVVSSRQGLLAKATVHRGQAELNVDSLAVKAGDTIDFLVDIGNKLSYNQFLWQATISSLDDSTVTFDSQRDFAGANAERLDAWQQLAQVLLASNEFMFVD
jgi:mono/diheme cytochrome c family protein